MSFGYARLQCGWSVRILSGHPAEPKGTFPAPAIDASLSTRSGTETAVFSGGCFWGVQGVIQHVKGVRQATSGYAGGAVENPYYELVSSGSTGHAESVRVEFDPSQITYGKLLMIFFSVAHDPTQKDRQGPDIGTQYRSAVFYGSDEQRRIVEAYIRQINAAGFTTGHRHAGCAVLAFYQEVIIRTLTKHADDPYIAYNDLPKVARLKGCFRNSIAGNPASGHSV
jgi:peptide-methionine (S)-S-oxide reductase